MFTIAVALSAVTMKLGSIAAARSAKRRTPSYSINRLRVGCSCGAGSESEGTCQVVSPAVRPQGCPAGSQNGDTRAGSQDTIGDGGTRALQMLAIVENN